MTNEIVLYQPDESVQLEVRVQDESVWLSQQQMAELFATDRTSILRHISNIYKTCELEESATCAKIAQVRQEGNRTIVRQIPFYNLDMIISVGYRVNSIRGTRFRQWANKVIKDYMLKGYAVNQRLLNIEDQLAEQLIARGGNINFIKWETGSVLPETGRAMEHMASFDYGYKIAAVRDWLFKQSKE